ncbi:PD40 domain-containing protein [Actinomadura barringtoniae]|uniref:PD40 domain-containing protein n=1 Tax=Actinomadura barringtoniae TaxID=1427535 RepID=A0A939PIJ5_9ACTN|nr:PD40 domain-containing protein [Actinomadura barringtoniae]MBO2450464.1 PD40 domain-containing protein [Actinomadura barringtoniae]
MNELERRLRDALHATADTVDEYKERPLPTHTFRSRTPSRRLVPILTAVAVLILIAGALGIRHLLHDDPKPLRKPPVVPKYVVAAMPATKSRPSTLEVREIHGGRQVAAQRVADHRLAFTSVAGSGDGRTFFVVVSPRAADSCSADVRRLTLAPSGAIEDLQPTGLSFPFSSIRDLAVSPDGKKIAYARSCTGGQNDMGSYDTAARTKTTWTVPASQYVSSLAWTPDGRSIAFALASPGISRSMIGQLGDVSFDGPGGEARLLDPGRSPQGDLRTHSTRLLTAPRDAGLTGVRISSDGRQGQVYAVYYIKRGIRGQETEYLAVGSKLITVSLVSGQQTSVIPIPGARGSDPAVLDGEASGRYLLTGAGVVDLRQGGRIERIAGLSGALDVSW